MAPIAQSGTAASAAKAAQDARQLALPVVAIGVIIAVLYYGRVFFITSIVAVVIAFILEPFVMLLTRIRFPRPLASFVVCTVALLLLYVVGAGAYAQLAVLIGDLPRYGERIGQIVEGVQQKVDDAEQQTWRLLAPSKPAPPPQQPPARGGKRSRTQPPPVAQPAVIPEVRIHEERKPVADFVTANIGSFYQILLTVSFVPFLVYFMLSWHDHINRSFLQFFHGEDRLVAARSLQGVAEMVRAFVVGNFVLGLLLAVSSSIVFWIMRLPYPMLVGPLSGFLSLVPYVGLPLAMAPPLFSALAINRVPVYAGVIGVTGVLHLVALNLLYPKVVGSRVHLNPLVVTFSLMLWGFLWDAPGLLLAIPMTAALKAVCDNVKGLRPIGKFLGD
ncbi:MAG: AI-2E family transporter [Bryobacteraceae bacterium]